MIDTKDKKDGVDKANFKIDLKKDEPLNRQSYLIASWKSATNKTAI